MELLFSEQPILLLYELLPQIRIVEMVDFLGLFYELDCILSH